MNRRQPWASGLTLQCVQCEIIKSFLWGPTMDIITASYLDILRPYQERLKDLAVPTVMICSGTHEHGAGVLPCPKALEPFCRECGETMVKVAQFWAHGRLWAIGFCPDWSSHTESPTAVVVSVACSDALPNHAKVAGNDLWKSIPALVLRDSDDPVFLAHPVLLELGLEANYSDELRQALGMVTEAITGLDNPSPGPRWAESCLGGIPMPIQWEPGTTPCPCCGQRLTFLGQFGPEVGVYYGDSGVLYAFACLDHPEHALVDCQMC